MDLWNDTERSLAELNTELSHSDDPARIRFMVVQPDPDWDGEWVLTTIWELPSPGRGGESWPDDRLMKYEQMVADRFAGIASTSCLFRTKKTVARAYRNAQPVAEAADSVPKSR